MIFPFVIVLLLDYDGGQNPLRRPMPALSVPDLCDYLFAKLASLRRPVSLIFYCSCENAIESTNCPWNRTPKRRPRNRVDRPRLSVPHPNSTPANFFPEKQKP